MDPQVTWNELLFAWRWHQWSEVIELADALLEWLEKGGFPPETTSPKEFGADWNKVVAEAAASFAKQRATQVVRDPNGIPRDVAFTLTCADCANEGPGSFAEATSQGWSNIQYVPEGMSENFLGRCRHCRTND